MIKILLARLGLGNRQESKSAEKISAQVSVDARYIKEMSEELLKLRKKGISIPVFTL